MKFAYVFPGQGAQRVGMGKELADSFDVSRQTFDAADAALNENLSGLIFDGPQEDLTLTANTQPSIVTVSIAALRALRARCDLAPTFVAGHSLGEFSALVAAGAMDFADAVRTTRARGMFMQEAVPAGHGAMAAIMKMEPEDVAAACREAAGEEVVSPANFNCPGQIVISGHAAAVDRAVEIVKGKGGRAIPLKVSAPFHCALMAPAATRLDSFLGDIRFATPSPAVVTNVEASPNDDPDKIKDLLVRQVTSTVRWTESINYMIDNGVKTFVELGPGNVLAGLIAKIDNTCITVSVSAPPQLDKAVELLNG